MRRIHTRNFLATLAAFALLAAVGCSTEPYCVGTQCFTGEAGTEDTETADVDPDADAVDGDGVDGETEGEAGEVETGDEDVVEGDAIECEAGLTACGDECVDPTADPANCGECGNRCRPERGYGACVDGVCVIEACAVEFVDCNGSYDDGCEVYCVPRISGDCDPATCTGPGCDTSCNNRVDDCHCEHDDCVDKTSDPLNCGACGLRCRFPNADGVCVDGGCEMGACHCGYHDINDSPVDGCEYECGATDCSAPPAETCNLLDDDCDGAIDQGDPGGGGPCGSDVGECELGVEHCIAGRIECVGSHGAAPAELCNDLDDDCDDLTDEDDPEGGVRCGLTTGECEQGLTQCIAGTVECVGDVRPATEL